MSVVIYALFGLLLLKCLYNLTIPYTLLGKMSRDEEGGISFMPYVEAFLLVVVVVLSFFAAEDSFASDPKMVGFIGLGIVATSYLHLVLVMMLGGWFVSRNKKGEE